MTVEDQEKSHDAIINRKQIQTIYEEPEDNQRRVLTEGGGLDYFFEDDYDADQFQK